MERQPPTFEGFAQFIREHTGVSQKKLITLETQFERDLGITGDDGDELLMATENRFGVRFVTNEYGLKELFNLKPNEYLFHSEGIGCVPIGLLWPFGVRSTVRVFTVGELYEVVCKLTEDNT
jgi:acyl carrier protein